MSEINSVDCDENGYHPEHKHLVWCDVESHHILSKTKAL